MVYIKTNKENAIGNEFKEKETKNAAQKKRQIGIWARTPARQRYLEKKINGVRVLQGNSSQHIRVLVGKCPDQCVNREIHGNP